MWSVNNSQDTFNTVGYRAMFQGWSRDPPPTLTNENISSVFMGRLESSSAGKQVLLAVTHLPPKSIKNNWWLNRQSALLLSLLRIFRDIGSRVVNISGVDLPGRAGSRISTFQL